MLRLLRCWTRYNVFMRQFFLLIIIGVFFLSCNSTKPIRSEERWYTLLPVCPCKNPDHDSIRTNDGWAREKRRDEMSWLKKIVMGRKDFTHFHSGAAASFRSYPSVLTFIDGKKYHSGQQCTYDEKGNLIKSGPGAGTPDKVSPARGEKRNGTLRVNILRVYNHSRLDAKPWKEMGWEPYNKLWPPDQGLNCGF